MNYYSVNLEFYIQHYTHCSLARSSGNLHFGKCISFGLSGIVRGEKVKPLENWFSVKQSWYHLLNVQLCLFFLLIINNCMLIRSSLDDFEQVNTTCTLIREVTRIEIEDKITIYQFSDTPTLYGKFIIWD